MTTTKAIEAFLKFSWSVPSDVLLRTADAAIWSRQKFVSPVLDIGSGEGSMGKIVFAANLPIDVGMDVDKNGIERAKATKAYKKLIVGDARHMPFKAKSFSTIVSNSTFEHIEIDDTPAIKEVARTLKNRGLFMITVPSDRFRDSLKKYIDNSKEFTAYNTRVAQYRYRSIKQWKAILKRNGLHVTNYEYYFSSNVLPYWYRMFKTSTLRFRNRELWSYLRDSKYSKYVPMNLLISVLKPILIHLFRISQEHNGTWLFITAQKIV